MTHRVRVTLYTKPGCHLCEEAKQEILRACCGDAYVLEEVDIESDPVLFKRYGMEIPVVVINGLVAFKYHVTAAEFERQIRRARED